MTHPSIHAQTHPDKPAYILAGSGESVTYGQLERPLQPGRPSVSFAGAEAGVCTTHWHEGAYPGDLGHTYQLTYWR